MELNFGTLTERLNDDFHRMLSEYRIAWRSVLSAELQDYITSYRGFLQSDRKAENFWQGVESFIVEQISWCDKSETILKEFREQDFWKTADPYYESLFSEIPESIEIPTGTGDWNPAASDSIDISLWKFYRRSRHKLLTFNLTATNRLRALLKKPLREMPAFPPRKVFVHQLTTRYIRWQLNRLILREWKLFQRELGKLLYDLNIHSEKFINRLILLNKDAAFTEDGEKSQNGELNPELTEISEAMQGCLDSFIAKTGSDSDTNVEKLESLKSEFALKWEYCGTSALSPSKYDTASISREREKAVVELQESNSRWELQFSGELGDWRANLHYSLLQIKAVTIGKNLVNDALNSIEDGILHELSHNLTLVEKCNETVKSWNDLTPVKTVAALKRENRQLIKGLRQERLLLLTDTTMQKKLLYNLRNYLTQMTVEIETIPEKQMLMVKRDFEQLVPNPKVDFIPSRELVAIYGLEPLNTKHIQLMDEAESTHRATLRTISMMDQIIDFQFETAINHIQQNKGEEALAEAKQVLTDGLERLVGQFNDLIEENRSFIVGSRQTIEQMTWEFIDSIQMLEDSERVFELNLRLTRAKTKSHYQAMRKTVLTRSKRTTLSTLKFFGEWMKRVFSSYKRLQKITGIEESKVRVVDEILRLLAVSYSPLDKLPIVYQRLFKIEALSEEKFFFQRQREFNALKDEYYNWQDDPASPVMLIGEKGSGKSTLINFAKPRIYSDSTLYLCTTDSTIESSDELLKLLLTAFGLKEIKTLEQLESKILEEFEPCVVIFEDIQRLFLRKVGGFRELQRLLLFISRTGSKIHWLMSCSLYSWEFIDKAINCSKYFHKLIYMKELSAGEIQSIIMQRHRTSGFDILFRPTESMLRSTKYKKLPSERAKQELLSDEFFKELYEIAKGNVTVAMLFWITSIKEIRKGELVLSTVLSWDQSPFQKMPADELFTLAAVIQHDGLTVAQHAQVFYQDTSRSLSIITRLKNSGLLIEGKSGFTIQPILYRPIVQVLRNKNILH